jgi:hypothetical protein
MDVVNNDDDESQERHNKFLRCELKKKSPNEETVMELFVKGSTQRIEWIQRLPGASRSSEVLQDYPCYAKAHFVSTGPLP